MAKNVGLLDFEGAIGDVVAYNRNGKRILARKGGFNGERMKTEERYEPVRKRQSEFGRCAKLSSSIKRALDVWLGSVPEVMLYNHIQSVVMGVKNCDMLSAKGAKTFEKGLITPEGAALFKKFQLNPKRSLEAGLAVTQAFDFETGVVTVLPDRYKLTASKLLGLELLLFRVDLETYDYQLVASGMQYCKQLGEAVTLEVAVTTGTGLFVAFLYAGKAVKNGPTMALLRDAEMGFGVLDYKLVAAKNDL